MYYNSLRDVYEFAQHFYDILPAPLQSLLVTVCMMFAFCVFFRLFQ